MRQCLRCGAGSTTFQCFCGGATIDLYNRYPRDLTPEQQRRAEYRDRPEPKEWR